MKQSIILSSLFGSLCIYLLVINFFETAAMLLLFGIYPGGVTAINPQIMLLGYTAVGLFVIGMLLTPPITKLIATRHPRQQA